MTSMLKLASLAAVLAALTACGPDHPSGSAAASSGAAILDTGREYAKCVREHGQPDYPDPHLNGPYLEFAAGVQVTSPAREECAPILQRLPGTAFGKSQQRQVSDADLATLRQFAKCVRDRGLSWFPDPGPDGSFRINGTPLAEDRPVPEFDAAMQACKQFQGPGLHLERQP